MERLKKEVLVDTVQHLLSTLSDSEKKEILTEMLKGLLLPLSKDAKKDLFSELQELHGIPISAFQAPLSGLETLCVYLRDYEQKSFRDMATLLNRSKSTLYTTYANAKKKFSGTLNVTNRSKLVPYSVFSNRTYSVLESLVFYLKKKRVSFVDIAKLIGRSVSTIRTVYYRYLKKSGK